MKRTPFREKDFCFHEKEFIVGTDSRVLLVIINMKCNIFSEFIDFVFTPLCEKDFCFHEKELGVTVVD